MKRVHQMIVSMVIGSLIVLSQFGVPVSGQQMKGGQKPAESLYKRLGGYDALAAVVDDFVPRLLNDPQLGRFFGGVSTNSTQRIRQLVVDQLCAATGGPCLYIGRDMKTAHAGLGISEKEWDISVKHLSDTLNKFKVPEREKNEVLTAISSLKADIVEKQ